MLELETDKIWFIFFVTIDTRDTIILFSFYV